MMTFYSSLKSKESLSRVSLLLLRILALIILIVFGFLFWIDISLAEAFGYVWVENPLTLLLLLGFVAAAGILLTRKWAWVSGLVLSGFVVMLSFIEVIRDGLDDPPDDGGAFIVSFVVFVLLLATRKVFFGIAKKKR